MYCELFAILDSDVLVLTANQRLTEYLFRDYNYQQQQKKLTAWTSPNIMPLNLWLTDVWQKNPKAHGTLLSDLEEKLLWQSIITADPSTHNVLQINQVVQLAKSAKQTLQLWQVKLDEIKTNANEEVAKFATIAEQFDQFKAKKELFTQADIVNEVMMLIKNNVIQLPKSIILYGFDQLSPAINSLIEILKTQTKVCFFQLSAKNKSIQRVALDDEEQEITAMAHWAKQKLKEIGKRDKIGCVIPKLSTNRDKVARIFCDIFTPENIIPAQTKVDSPYNISAGIALSLYPIVSSAINVLMLAAKPTQTELQSALLLSPHINSTADERALGALTDYKLRETGKINLDSNIILSLLNQGRDQYYQNTTLANRWLEFCKIQIPEGKQPFSFWTELFQQLFDAIGWPGQRTLSSEEYQIMQRLQQTFYDLNKMTNVFRTLNYQKALFILKESLQQIVFQPQTEDKPIQILGTLEAMGCQFTHLWFMGLDDETWPAKPNPNPFLPINLQRTKKMPHSSATRELEFATQLQKHLVDISQHVMLSHPLQEGDKQLRPSQLIKSIDKIDYPQRVDSINLQKIELEQLEDNQAPPVTDNEQIRGGSWILQQQALCPFRAFANVRLNASPIETTDIGLNALIRGTVTHFALDHLWKEIKNQENLINLDQNNLNQLINQSINAAILATNLSQNQYVIIEQRRLQNLLEKWLQVEKNRPNFKVVERESQRHIKIGKLSIKIQIDRIDELNDGTQFIIDYKTGKNNHIANWLGMRPAEPQLPIYCLYGSETSVGLAYAEVNLASLKYKGIINAEQTFSKISTVDKLFKKTRTWEDLKNQWQQSLDTLADEFIRGEARVDPQNNITCQYCHLHALCRIGDEP